MEGMSKRVVKRSAPRQRSQRPHFPERTECRPKRYVDTKRRDLLTRDRVASINAHMQAFMDHRISQGASALPARSWRSWMKTLAFSTQLTWRRVRNRPLKRLRSGRRYLVIFSRTVSARMRCRISLTVPLETFVCSTICR